MNNYRNQNISQLRRDADAAWSNLDGGVAGGRKEEFLGMNGRTSYMEGAVHSSGMRVITFDIQNTDENHFLSAALFGANEGFIQPFNGIGSLPGTTVDFITGSTPATAKGIVVTPKRYTLTELQNLSRTSPFVVQGMRYDFGDTTQLKQEWTMRRKEGTKQSDDVYEPQIFRNLGNNVQEAMDDKDFFMKVDDKATLFIVLAPALSSTVPRKIQVTLNVSAEVDIANALKNQAVVTINR